MKSLMVALLVMLVSSNTQAMFNDDPWLTKVISEIEYLQEDGENIMEWDIDAWYGKDLSKFWIKSSGEYAKSDIESANIELVYSKAISAYWDRQFGVRHDFKPNPDGNTRNWLSYGYIGTAPYFIKVDARVFIGEESSSQLLIELERELMITQQWVLTPELDIILNGHTNELFVEGSGLSEIEFSLRLGYERNGDRKFQPFIGFTVNQTFGATKHLLKTGSDSSSGQIETIIGIHSWF